MVYEGQWKERARRKAVFNLALWGGWLGTGALVILLELGFAWLIALGILWISLTTLAGYRFFDWPCPRCGKPFLMDLPSRSNPAAKRCLHCGLPLGAGRDPSEAPEWIQDSKGKMP